TLLDSASFPTRRSSDLLVDELVRELVVCALHVPILDAPEPARNPARLEEQLLERRVLDAVLAAHLLDHQMRGEYRVKNAALQERSEEHTSELQSPSKLV